MSGETIRLRIGGPAHGGTCVARRDGQVVFVYGTAPGELVEVEIIESRSKLLFARATQILEPSADRIAHIWPLAERTFVGGADLGHITAAAGRRWKAEVVAQQLLRIAHLEVDVEVQETAPLAYRTRIEAVVSEGGGLAMHKQHSHDLIEIDSMPLAVDAITELAPWDGRYRPGERITVVHSSGADEQPAQTRIATGAHLFEHVVLDGQRYQYRVNDDGFWQVHLEAPRRLVQQVQATLPSTTPLTVFDLYCGSGLFTLPLVQAGHRVYAVESNEAAAANALFNTEGNARVFAADVLQALQRRTLPNRADVILLDPPRAGVGRQVVEAICARQPAHIIYVSCDPASLARDTNYLSQHGYHLTHLQALDLFPHTHHIESIAQFTH
ncbi:MAG: TRAM domain-containing protein [Propionibacteriaceae bacterium]|jgi:tRNA/tmRNA/rRNA uracil-C5-methylase (TrmA/RlmC/RlmD family)|nr:TRAM domain-containing protein [Propionibacteriaceae bacterium]